MNFVCTTPMKHFAYEIRKHKPFVKAFDMNGSKCLYVHVLHMDVQYKTIISRMTHDDTYMPSVGSSCNETRN